MPNELKEALIRARRWLASEPANPVAHALVGELLSQLADGAVGLPRRRYLAAAAEAFGQALALHPTEAAFAFDRAMALDALAHEWELVGEPGEATRLYGLAQEGYRGVVALDPSHHKAWNNWGASLADEAQALAERGEVAAALPLFAEAFQCYATALKVKPDRYATETNWGVALEALAKLSWRAGETALAEAHFEAAYSHFRAALATEADPQTTFAWASCLGDHARLLAEAGRRAEAASRYLAACQRYDYAFSMVESADVLNNWGVDLALSAVNLWHLGHEGEARQRLSQASAHFAQALTLSGGDPEIYDSWGLALQGFGRLLLAAGQIDEGLARYREACAKFEQALSHGGNLPFFSDHYLACLTEVAEALPPRQAQPYHEQAEKIQAHYRRSQLRRIK